jgi:DNA-binding response OmpR family regulator
MEKQRILVVDDDVDLCDSLRVLLENAGYEISSAGNKAEGMEKTRSERPDLIILDVVMDTWQDGFEMSRELKGDPAFMSVPILMLTSIETKTGIEFKSTAGDSVWLPVDGFLDKPAPPDRVLAEVRRLLQRPGASRPIRDVAVRRESFTESGSCPSGR